MQTSCACGANPYAGKPVKASAIPFVVGGGAAPFDRAGTHAPTMELCGCDTGNHRNLGIEVNSAWWAKLSPAERHGVVAHEHCHATGIQCEACCDRHGGWLMRSWGYTLDGIAQAFSFVQTRDASGAALEGARAFDQGAGTEAGSAGYDSSWQVDAAGISLPTTRRLPPVRGQASPAPTPSKPSTRGARPPAFRAAPPVQATAPAPRLPTAPTSGSQITITDPSFNPSTPVDANPSLLDQLDQTLTGQKIDPTIVRSEVVSGLLVAFLVFVVFRWGGS